MLEPISTKMINHHSLDLNDSSRRSLEHLYSIANHLRHPMDGILHQAESYSTAKSPQNQYPSGTLTTLHQSIDIRTEGEKRQRLLRYLR